MGAGYFKMETYLWLSGEVMEEGGQLGCNDIGTLEIERIGIVRTKTGNHKICTEKWWLQQACIKWYRNLCQILSSYTEMRVRLRSIDITDNAIELPRTENVTQHFVHLLLTSHLHCSVGLSVLFATCRFIMSASKLISHNDSGRHQNMIFSGRIHPIIFSCWSAECF